jgi:hypothetical protein
MTDLNTTLRPTSETVAPSPATPVERPVLITEQQVRFGTAAAVALPPAKPRRWAHAMETVAAAVQGFFAGPTEPVRRHYPKRYGYLENALMAREMDRL